MVVASVQFVRHKRRAFWLLEPCMFSEALNVQISCFVASTIIPILQDIANMVQWESFFTVECRTHVGARALNSPN